MPIKSLYKELEISTDSGRPVVSNNISELLLAKSNLTFLHQHQNNTAGMDMRLRKPEPEVVNIRKNMAKKRLLDFLKNPDISDMEKISQIRDPEMAELISSSNDTDIRGFRMGAGGFWRDWEDSIFLFL
jgi:hypothetical protein